MACSSLKNLLQRGEFGSRNINTDTRTIESGEVFLALKGPNFDGHRFLEVAKARGAIAAIVSCLMKILI